jgi:hypothetical protein
MKNNYTQFLEHFQEPIKLESTGWLRVETRLNGIDWISNTIIENLLENNLLIKDEDSFIRINNKNNSEGNSKPNTTISEEGNNGKKRKNRKRK